MFHGPFDQIAAGPPQVGTTRLRFGRTWSKAAFSTPRQLLPMNRSSRDQGVPRKNDNVYYGLPISFLFAVMAGFQALLLRMTGYFQHRTSWSAPYQLLFHFDAHLASGANQSPVRSLFRAGIHIFNLQFNDIHHLLFRQLGDLRLIRFFRTRRDICRLLQ